MSIEDAIYVEVAIERLLENGLCLARLRNGHQVVAHVRRRDHSEIGALRVGDSVRLEMSPFDMSKGCILFKKTRKLI